MTVRDSSDLLLPYVPRIAVDWLQDRPAVAHRRLEGTLAFCDVSGFTALTERLAERGLAGAEEMGDALNHVFTELLVEAYQQGAELIKYGGDAVLLLFRGENHAVRGARASWTMQRAMASVGAMRTSVGPAQLRMSVGVHTGELDLFLAGSGQRELVVTGPAATATAEMEAAAEAGEILLSPSTAAELSPGCLGPERAGGQLLAAPPGVSPLQTYPLGELPDLSLLLSPGICAHVRSGWTESQHRVVVPGFLEFTGVDQLLADGGGDAVAAALTELVDVVATASARHDVTFLGTDIGKDGGKAIVVAGAPRNPGDLEERVLATLREVLDRPSRLKLRAGAACGRAFSGDYGPPYRRTYSVVGDVVNLAARLMGKAAPGSLLVSRELIAGSRRPFEVREVAGLILKGKREPVTALEVGAPLESGDDGTVAEATSFVGRDNELTAFRDALSAVELRRGRVVEIAGEAGLGKTRLVQEALAGSQVPVHTVTCDAYTAATAYAPIRRLLRAVAGVAPTGSLRHVLETGATHLLPWWPLLATVVGERAETTPEVQALDERFLRQRTAQVVAELLTVAVDQPAALVVEDAHLADDGTLEVLKELQAVAAERPWLLVLVHRRLHEPLAEPAPHVAPLWLTPLDDVAARTLLSELTAEAPLHPHVEQALLARAAGNPLFLRELASLGEQLEADALPSSLDGLATAQVDALPAAEQRALRVAAVLGAQFSAELLEDVLAAEGLRLDESLLERLERFLEVDEAAVRFRTAVVRDAAYGALPFRRRADIHGKVGRAIELQPGEPDLERTNLLSFHFWSAGEHDRALHWSRLAAEQAAAAHLRVEAARTYDRALAAARRLRRREDVRELGERAATAWIGLGEFARAEHALARTLPMADDPLRRADLRMWSGYVRVRTGRHSQALGWFTRALRDLADREDQPALAVRARIKAFAAFARHLQGRHPQSLVWARSALADAERANAKDAVALACQLIDWAHVALGNFEHGAFAARSLRLWEELGDRNRQAMLHNHMGMRAYWQGDWPRAVEHYRTSLELLQTVGDQWNAAIATGNIAEIEADQGEWDRAETATREALRVFQASNTASFVGLWATQLGRIAARRGDYAAALTALDQARTAYAAAGESEGLLEVDSALAEAHVLADQPDLGLAVADAALAVATEGVPAALPRLLRWKALAQAQLGDLTAALEGLQLALEAARHRGSRLDVALCLRALAQLAPEDADARARRREAAELGDALGIVAYADPPLTRPVVPAPAEAAPTEGLVDDVPLELPAVAHTA